MNTIGLLSALALALASAYFSVLGLSQIFHGAFWPVLIMGTVLEVAKFSTALLVHKHWGKLSYAIRAYLSVATIVLMVLTSAGIFGFLAKSSQSTAAGIATQTNQIQYLDKSLAAIQVQRARQEKVIESLDKMVGVYTTQAKFEDARVGVRLFARQKAQRQEAESEISRLNEQEATLQNRRLELDQKVQAVELEVGPAVYIAQALYGGKDISSVESAIRIVIFMIIFAFDPLAICLLLAVQRVNETNKPVAVAQEQAQQVAVVSAKEEAVVEDVQQVAPSVFVTGVQQVTPEVTPEVKEKLFDTVDLVVEEGPKESPIPEAAIQSTIEYVNENFNVGGNQHEAIHDKTARMNDRRLRGVA